MQRTKQVMWPPLISKKLLQKRPGSEQSVGKEEEEEEEEEEIVSIREGFLEMPCCRKLIFPSQIPCHDNKHNRKYKVFVSTWNVGGIAPPEDLNLEDWLDSNNGSSDIYVLGFQEIVPLNARNILGSENRRLCAKWNKLIGACLNKKAAELENNQDLKTAAEKQKIYPVKDQYSGAGIPYKDEFQCIISKQMVGIFVSVWVRGNLLRFISRPSVSCVGCGIMGCLGNKGSVSVSFSLQGTSFCFVCSHLASGGKEGDEIHRNSDALEILSRTTFPPRSPLDLPTKILDHDRIIWLGDLNYRISLTEPVTRLLVEEGEWKILQENDQLRVELSEGGVFQGWHEENIRFRPTYKYCLDSNEYYGWLEGKKGQKKRAPAWCDRILWYGKGLKQNSYERGESRLSDHRPVRAIFTAEVDVKSIGSIFLSHRYESFQQSMNVMDCLPKRRWSFRV